MKDIIIAIDGYSSCGKSTLAKALAKELQYVYIDTGAMYRAVALYFLRNDIMKNGEVMLDKVENALDNITLNFQYNNQINKAETILNGVNVEQEIRGLEVSENVSKVSRIKSVRAKMVELQQKMGQQKRIVMDGRDIGTVVFPDAELKLFMTADEDVRAQRRFKELQEKGENITIDQVKKNIASRDFADTTREENPLKQANDAVVIDNTNITPQEQFDLVMKLVKERVS